MNFEQILQVIDAVSKSSLSGFKFEGDGVKFSLKKSAADMPGEIIHPFINKSTSFPSDTDSQECGVNGIGQKKNDTHENTFEDGASSGNRNDGVAINANAGQDCATDSNNAEEKLEKEPIPEGNVVKSPLVGTFYVAPSEDSDSFVKLGDHVEKGQVLAIIEAMKLMNEIESDFTGTVTEILVENGEAVEYGQPLFLIK